MKDPNRIHRILDKLMQYWVLNPEQTLGVIISCHLPNVFTSAISITDKQIEQLLDKRLLEAEAGITEFGTTLYKDKDRMVTRYELYED